MLAAVAVWLFLFRNGPLINDTAWQLWIGRQLNGGGRLYVDILEVNPPLWFWLGRAVQAVAAAVGLPPLSVLIAFFALAAAVAIILVARLVDGLPDRVAYQAGLVMTLFLTASFALGQREQYALIAAVPYAALIAARAQRRSPPWLLALAVGLFAATGLALKHYFILLPLALELWLFWRLHRIALRPELIALIAAAIAYAIAIAIVTPAYLSVMLPLIRLAYATFTGGTLAEQWAQPAVVASLLSLFALRFAPKREMNAEAAAVAAAGFLGAYLIQAKGFDYHAIPALGFALITVLCLLARPDNRRGSALLASLAAVTLAAAVPIKAGPPRFDGPARRATAGLPPHSPILVLSGSGTAAWPLVEERGFRWPSKHMTLWMLTSVWLDRQQPHPSSKLQRLGRKIRAETAVEIACAKPSMILVDGRYDSLAGPGGVIGYFRGDPAFSAELRAYRRQGDVGYLQVYARTWDASSGSSHCGSA